MLIPPKNTVYKLAKGAENPSIDLVNDIKAGALKVFGRSKLSASSGVNGHQVGDVKSSAAVGRTNTSAVGTLPTYSKRAWSSMGEQLVVPRRGASALHNGAI